MGVPLDRYPVLLLDLNSTFMFGEDRFGPDEDFAATYRALGGPALADARVMRAVRDAHAWLAARYDDPACEDDFPSIAEALAAVAGDLDAAERESLARTVARHEVGVIPPAHASAVRSLAAAHELRLLSNVWTPREPWLDALRDADLLGCFRRIVFSSDGRSLKPSRRLTDEALAGVRCAAREVLMIGDSVERDMEAGRRAGLATAWIAGGRPLAPEHAALVDFRVESLLDLAMPPTPVTMQR